MGLAHWVTTANPEASTEVCVLVLRWAVSCPDSQQTLDVECKTRTSRVGVPPQLAGGLDRG